MRARTGLAVLAGIAFLSVPFVAEAHFTLTMPPPADGATDGGKGAPPCGPTTATNVVTPAQGGHPLMIALDETLMHPGWYRIALSINARSELPADPMVTVSGGNSTNAAYQDPAVFPVLADHVFVHTTGTAPIHFQMNVTLPNITCAKCTLQVIEFMNMHGSNPGGGYFYHHCADLMITADPNLPDGGVTDAGSGTGGRGGAGGGGGRAGTGGSAPGTGGRGGAAGATEGTGGAAGSATGTGGTTGAAGASVATGGTTGAAGASAGTGGTTGSAGASAGTGGTAGRTGGAGSSGGPPASSDGCGCAVSGVARNTGTIGSLLMLATLLRRRRRR